MFPVIPKVIIIDDHQVLIEGLSALLSAEHIPVTGTANNLEESIALIKETVFNIALVDINLGGEDGLELVEKIKEQGKKVLILSSYTDIRLIKEALKKGVDGYLTKESTSEFIITAIRTVANGESFFDPIIQKKMNASFVKQTNVTKPKERSITAHLTEREKEVLTLIAQQMTSDEIAAELYIAKSTVDTYRKNLIKKLKVKNAVGLGIWANKNGII